MWEEVPSYWVTMVDFVLFPDHSPYGAEIKQFGK